jgi:hypothetical protein
MATMRSFFNGILNSLAGTHDALSIFADNKTFGWVSFAIITS